MQYFRRRLTWAVRGATTALALVVAAALAPPAQAAAPYPDNSIEELYVSKRTEVGEFVRRAANGPLGFDPNRRHVAFRSMLSSTPTALWLSDWNGQAGVFNVRSLVASEVAQAQAQRKIPQIVPYMLPYRDCANLSDGGAPTYGDYRGWIGQLAAGLRQGLETNPDRHMKVYVLLEPDAVALQSGDPGCVDFNGNPVTFDVEPRNEALRYAIDRLTRAGCPKAGGLELWCGPEESKVKVFLDTGHSAWYGGNIRTMVTRLRNAGVEDAYGFYSNASNYQPTANEVTYGKNLKNALGTQHLVHAIDTSRNGAAIPTGRQADTGWPDWCDPTPARIGTQPSNNPGDGTIHLWIKPPGETDGCYGGSSTVGTPGRDGRGVPADGLPAGTFSHVLACRLITGSPNLNSCNVDITTIPARPDRPRITKTWQKGKNGAKEDALLLQWEPVFAACVYQIGYRGSDGRIHALKVTGGDDRTTHANPSYLLVGDQVKRGSTVYYAVRARRCAEAAGYSSYSSMVATRAFP